MTFPQPSEPTTAVATRTLRLPRPPRWGVVALAAVSMAVIPVSGALALGGSHKPPAGVSAPEPGEPGSGGVGEREHWWSFGRSLHGEEFVERKDGTVADLVFQYGTVNAITATSVTLQSKDGFKLTWTITAATKVWVRGHHRDRGRVPVVGDQAGLWGYGPAATPTATQFVVSTERRHPAPSNSGSSSGSSSASASSSSSASASSSSAGSKSG